MVLCVSVVVHLRFVLVIIFVFVVSPMVLDSSLCMASIASDQQKVRYLWGCRLQPICAAKRRWSWWVKLVSAIHD